MTDSVVNTHKIKSTFFISLIAALAGAGIFLYEMMIHSSNWIMWTGLLLLALSAIIAGSSMNNFRSGYGKLGAGLAFMAVGTGLRMTYADLFAWLMMLLGIAYGALLIYRGYMQMENSDAFEYEEGRLKYKSTLEIIAIVIAVLIFSLISTRLLLSILGN